MTATRSEEELQQIHLRLGLAVENGDLALAKSILMETENYTPEERLLSDATRNGHIDMIKMLLDDPDIGSRYKFDVNDGFALEMACNFGSLESVRFLLLERQAKINGPENDGMPLLCAINNGEVEIVRFLLGSRELVHRADPSLCKTNPLIVAFQSEAKGTVATARLLLYGDGFEPIRPDPFDASMADNLVYTYFDDEDIGFCFDVVRPFMDKKTLYTAYLKYPRALNAACELYPDDREVILGLLTDDFFKTPYSVPLLRSLFDKKALMEGVSDVAETSEKRKAIQKKI